jgi:hypothetical protein
MKEQYYVCVDHKAINTAGYITLYFVTEEELPKGNKIHGPYEDKYTAIEEFRALEAAADKKSKKVLGNNNKETTTRAVPANTKVLHSSSN